MKPTWQTDDGRIQLYRGEAIDLLRKMPPDSFDALITDPPYSSGGMFRSDRAANTTTKYVQSGKRREDRPDFSGDNRDGRSWAYWSHLWLSECLRLVKPRGYAMVFTDWRQLPTTTDVLQAAGFVWQRARPLRGIRYHGRRRA